MHIFRCYFLDDADHIKAFELIEAGRLSEAINDALAMFKARPHH